MTMKKTKAPYAVLKFVSWKGSRERMLTPTLAPSGPGGPTPPGRPSSPGGPGSPLVPGIPRSPYDKKQNKITT